MWLKPLKWDYSISRWQESHRLHLLSVNEDNLSYADDKWQICLAFVDKRPEKCLCVNANQIKNSAKTHLFVVVLHLLVIFYVPLVCLYLCFHLLWPFRGSSWLSCLSFRIKNVLFLRREAQLCTMSIYFRETQTSIIHAEELCAMPLTLFLEMFNMTKKSRGGSVKQLSWISCNNNTSTFAKFFFFFFFTQSHSSKEVIFPTVKVGTEAQTNHNVFNSGCHVTLFFVHTCLWLLLELSSYSFAILVWTDSNISLIWKTFAFCCSKTTAMWIMSFRMNCPGNVC